MDQTHPSTGLGHPTPGQSWRKGLSLTKLRIAQGVGGRWVLELGTLQLTSQS